GSRSRAPPRGRTPRGGPRERPQPRTPGSARRWSWGTAHKRAAYRHATSGGWTGAEGSGDEELALADDRLAVHLDRRGAHRAPESEGRLVGAAHELVSADSDGDRAPHDRALKEAERRLRVRSDCEGGDPVPVSRRGIVLLSQRDSGSVALEFRQSTVAEDPLHA